MSSVYGQTLLDDMVRAQALPMPLVKQAAKEILAVIREGLVNDGVVNVSNFGTFRLKLAAARNGFNPQTKERITIPAHQRVIFSPCKALRDLIQPVHHAAIPIEPEATPLRAAARTAPIAAAAVVTKLIVPPSPPEDEVVERRVTPDRRHHAEQPEVTSQVETISDSADAIALEVGEETTTAERSKKGIYLGAAALIVIAAITASLLYNPTQEETPTTVVTLPSAPVSQAGSPLATETPVAEAPAEPPAPIPAEAETTAAEELDYSTLYTEMADAQPVVELPAAPIVAEPVATTVSKPATFFFTEKTHKIANGESLWRLAKQSYKNPLLWPHIYQANAALIDNPDSLRQGSTITLPSLQGSADNLTRTDRRNIAEGYYLTYLHYKKTGHKDAFFALLEAKRYDNKVVEEHRSLLQLSKVEEIMLGHQETMPF